MSAGLRAVIVAVIGALAFMPMAVEATPYASAVENMTGIQFVGAPAFGGFLFVTNPVSVNLNAGFLTSTGNSGGQGFTDNQPMQCLGAVCGTGNFVDNPGLPTGGGSWFPTPNLNAALGSYAVADSQMLATGIQGGNSGTFGTRTQAQLTGPSFARAQTGTSNLMFWSFQVSGANATVSMLGDLVRNFHLHTDAVGEAATGTLDFQIRILNSLGNIVADFTSDFNEQISPIQGARDINLASDAHLTNFGVFTTGVVLIPDFYSLTITFDSSTDVRLAAVPEPATLSLLGLGLVGATYLARRRRS